MVPKQVREGKKYRGKMDGWREGHREEGREGGRCGWVGKYPVSISSHYT